MSGAGWQSDHEWNAIRLAKEFGKKSVVFLDHWVHYRERFMRNGREYLPDEIWVGDIYAKSIAEISIPEVKVKLVPNPYISNTVNMYSKMKISSVAENIGLNILYICEPVREGGLKLHGNEKYWGYTEEEAIEYFLSNIKYFKSPINMIKFRPHPSELKFKYDWIKDKYCLPIKISRSKALIEEINKRDIVVGLQSMAMVIALELGKQVISCIPPSGRKCVLPHCAIMNLHEYITNSKK